jgi:hypothetical protein
MPLHEPGIERRSVISRMHRAWLIISPEPFTMRQVRGACTAGESQLRAGKLMQVPQQQVMERQAHFWPGWPDKPATRRRTTLRPR